MTADTPPGRRDLWLRFLAWVLGVPLAAAAAGAVVVGAIRLTGGALVWQAQSDMGTALFWIGAICLMYPAMLFVWIADLRAGLKARLEWEQTGEMLPGAAAARKRKAS